MKKFFIVSWGTGGGVKEIANYDEMIDAVRSHYNSYESHPTVFYGERLEFEPAEIVKSWKPKGWD